MRLEPIISWLSVLYLIHFNTELSWKNSQLCLWNSISAKNMEKWLLTHQMLGHETHFGFTNLSRNMFMWRARDNWFWKIWYWTPCRIDKILNMTLCSCRNVSQLLNVWACDLIQAKIYPWNMIFKLNLIMFHGN